MGNVYMEADQIRYKSASYRNVQEGLDAAFAGSPEGLDERVTALETTVGDSSDGLVKDVTDLQTTVGDSSAGLVKDVTDLQTTVGDSTAGLVKTVTDQGTAINGLQTTVGGAVQWDQAKTSVKKNMLPLSLDAIKALNDLGSWADNAYTYDNVTYTVITNDYGQVTGIVVNASAATTGQRDFILYRDTDNSCPYNGYILNGCPNTGSASTYDLRTSDIITGSNLDIGSGVIINLSDTGEWQVAITVRSGQQPTNVAFYPMIRPASIADDTFAPYILDNVELANALKYEESAFTNVPEGATVTANKLIKFGKVVMACATISGITASEWTTFLNIPDGFRPAINFKIIDPSASRYYTVFSGGYVQCSAALSANAIEIFATWITA